MQSKAATAEEYLLELPEDRREAISTLRDLILKRLKPGYAETMQYGMITYVVPHSTYPAGYHCDPKQAVPYLSLASQKNHMAVYMGCFWGTNDREAFQERYLATGKKLDLGSGCLRFKKLDQLAIDVVLDTIAALTPEQFIANYSSMIPESKKKKKA